MTSENIRLILTGIVVEFSLGHLEHLGTIRGVCLNLVRFFLIIIFLNDLGVLDTYSIIFELSHG
jgi:hypothetical protein